MQILLIFIRAHNPKVGGSNPSPATIKQKGLERGLFWFMGVMDENRVRAEVPIVSGFRSVKSALADEAILPSLLTIDTCSSKRSKSFLLWSGVEPNVVICCQFSHVFHYKDLIDIPPGKLRVRIGVNLGGLRRSIGQ